VGVGGDGECISGEGGWNRSVLVGVRSGMAGGMLEGGEMK